MNRAVLAFIVAMLFTANANAQTVNTGITPDTIRVGDPVRIVVRINDLPANSEVVLPDSIASSQDIEPAGPMRMRRDSLPNGNVRITAAWPILVWRPGENPLPPLAVIVRGESGERTLNVQLPAINVTSVLPDDTTNIQARPPKDVWGADRVWWPWVLAAALLLIAAALAYWWYRRRRAQRQVELPAMPVVDARAHALKELARIRGLGLIEQQQYRQFYIHLSEVLRNFAARMEPEWSTDLTTDELAPRLQARADARDLLGLLRNADMVKFARRQPAAEEAAADLDRAEQWVRSFSLPVPEPAADAEAA